MVGKIAMFTDIAADLKKSFGSKDWGKWLYSTLLLSVAKGIALVFSYREEEIVQKHTSCR